MSDDAVEQGIDRRAFIRAAAATAVAASAAGAGAALVTDQGRKPPAVAPPVTIPEPIQVAADASADVSQLMARLAAAQAENIRLQSQLNGVQRRLDAAQAATAEQNKAAAEAMQLELQEANSQVSVLSGQVGVLSGLVALYEQLDEIDLPAAIDGGLASVGEVLDDLAEKVPTATEGLQAGQQALADFEEQVPLLDDGRLWLNQQIEEISGYYDAVELALENAVEATGSFLQMLSEWFQNILKWLPFGLGDKAIGIMNALTNLLAAVPDTIAGLRQNVAQPLDVWLEKEGEETRLHRQLIKPVREGALDQAAEAIGQAQTLQTVYQSRLVEPVEEVASRQRAIRNSIAEYRQHYQL